jgi:hypothetical protein
VASVAFSGVGIFPTLTLLAAASGFLGTFLSKRIALNICPSGPRGGIGEAMIVNSLKSQVSVLDTVSGLKSKSAA